MIIILFLDVSTLKLRNIIIILPTERPEIILPTVHAKKIKLPSANIFRNKEGLTLKLDQLIEHNKKNFHGKYIQMNM